MSVQTINYQLLILNFLSSFYKKKSIKLIKILFPTALNNTKLIESLFETISSIKKIEFDRKFIY